MRYVLVTVEGKKVPTRLVSYDVRKGDFDHLDERAPAFDPAWSYGAAPK